MNGLCQCGCGKRTTLAIRNVHGKGIKKGQPNRFLTGHAGTGRFHSAQAKALMSEKATQRFAGKPENHNHWRGGIKILNQYVYLYRPDHPNAHASGYVKRSTLIVSEMLGRPLKPNELVHHIDGNRQNDTKRNFLVCTRAYHMSLHRRLAQQRKELDHVI